MTADVLTKPLSADLFAKCVLDLGVAEANDYERMINILIAQTDAEGFS
jgi:hypothetical protein